MLSSAVPGAVLSSAELSSAELSSAVLSSAVPGAAPHDRSNPGSRVAVRFFAVRFFAVRPVVVAGRFFCHRIVCPGRRRDDSDRLGQGRRQRHSGVFGADFKSGEIGAIPAVSGPLTVADRDSKIIGMDLAEGQKAVPIAPVFDKSRL